MDSLRAIKLYIILSSSTSETRLVVPIKMCIFGRTCFKNMLDVLNNVVKSLDRVNARRISNEASPQRLRTQEYREERPRFVIQIKIYLYNLR